MEKIWICVYRDSTEEHEHDSNLVQILVKREFIERYFERYQADTFDSVEEFLDEYTADNTQNLYEYAVRHNAVIKMEVL